MAIIRGTGPITKKELDAMRCENGCNDHPLTLHSVCHPDDPTWTEYDRDTGLLVVRCATCERPIVVIQPANGEAILH